jgi:hypothetical protein
MKILNHVEIIASKPEAAKGAVMQRKSRHI